MRRIAGISLLWVLLWCTACNTASEAAFGEGNEASYVSVKELKSICKGTTTPITRELKIRGVVTANDIRGEFPYTIVIEDATGGIEVSAEHSFLCDLFPLGETVTVYCNGLAVGEYGGKVRLGAKPTGSYSVDRIPREEIGRYIRCTEPGEYTRRARTHRIQELEPADIDTYIHLENIRFTTQESWCDRDPETGDPVATRRTITDTDGNELEVRIGAGCHYATEPIPSGTGSINGIVDYFYGTYSLRIVNYEVLFPTFEVPPTAYLSAGGYSAPTPKR